MHSSNFAQASLRFPFSQQLRVDGVLILKRIEHFLHFVIDSGWSNFVPTDIML